MKPIDITIMRRAVQMARIEWRKHVLQKLAERGLPQAGVLEVLLSGEKIRDYADDKPFPARCFWATLAADRSTWWRRAMRRANRCLLSRPTSRRWKFLKLTIEPNENHELKTRSMPVVRRE